MIGYHKGAVDEEFSEEPHPDREGGHPPEAPLGEGSRLGRLRAGGPEPHAVLPLAEDLLREWRGRLREGRAQKAEGCRGREDCGPGGQAAPQGRGPLRVDGGARRLKKRTWGALSGRWVPHDTRDTVVDFVSLWSEKTEIGICRFIRWLGVGPSK